MSDKYKNIANEIIDEVGQDNISSITHCATRLRIVVDDVEKINTEKVEQIDEVKGTFYNGGQYQIILGGGIVNKVYDEMENLSVKTSTRGEQEDTVRENESKTQSIMRTLGDIFVPIVPVIAATGLFLGLKGVIFNEDILAMVGLTLDIYPEFFISLTDVLTDTAFGFLPALITMSTFRVFKGTPMIGMVLGLMLVSPMLPNAYAVADPTSGVDAIMAFDFIPIMGTQGSVLTAILTGYLGSKLERKLRTIVPNSLDLILTPFITLLIMLIVVLMGFGPIVHWLEMGIIALTESLMNIPYGIGGFLIGFTYPLTVITGLHHMYVMIETSLLANTGFNQLITLCAMYGFANLGSALAYGFRAKNKKTKQIASGGFMSQLFGVSEPILFGIHLRYDLKSLYVMLVSSGLGAAALQILGVRSNSYGLAVLPSYLMYIHDGSQLISYFIVSIVTVAISYFLTVTFAIPKEITIEDR